jgi:hypothetical protein
MVFAISTRAVAHQRREPQELVQDVALVDDLLDTGVRGELLADDTEQRRVLELHAERRGQRRDVDGLDERRLVGEEAREPLVRLALRLVVHLGDDGLGLEVLLEPLPLLGRDRRAGAVVAEEDRDLDAAGPVVGREVDLLAQQQAGAEQRQRDGHREDDGEGHEQVAAQAAEGLGEHVPPARHRQPP